MNIAYARRTDIVKASEIRELLKLTEQPDIISFGGGLPAPELFPAEALIEICRDILTQKGGQALQYGPTEGYMPLRRTLVSLMAENGIEAEAEDVLITTGSQQVLDLAAKVFLDEGDIVFCESPTYLAAINAFNVYLPWFVEIDTDDDGMVPQALEARLQEGLRPKFVYIIPDFQNPSGRTMSIDRRRAFMELARRYDLLVLEDNPYSEVRFEMQPKPTLKSMDTDGRVLYTSTLSKTFCPGLRLGWVTGNGEIIRKMALFKQGADLHTNTFAQMMAHAFIETCDYKAHIETIRTAYRSRRDAMLRHMQAQLPEVRITHPEGGLFFWAELPAGMDSRRLLEKALEFKVAFVPGGAFFPEHRRENTLRLNFSGMTEEQIEEGVRRLRAALERLILESTGSADCSEHHGEEKA